MLDALQQNAILICGIAALVVAVAAFFATLVIIRRSGLGTRLARGTSDDAKIAHAIDQASDEAFVLYNRRTHEVEYASASMLRIMGVNVDAVYDDINSLQTAISPESRISLRQAVQEQRRKPYAFRCEFTYSEEAVNRIDPALSGEPQYGAMSFSKVDDAHCLIAFKMVTADRNLYSDLIQARDAAERGERAKLVFLSNMSHEIRTPMNGIMSILSLARHHLDDPARMNGYLDQADDLLKYLLSIINDVLDISKIDNNKLEVEERCFDLTGVIRSEEHLFGEMIASKGVKFIVEADELPTDFVIGDELRLTQVVTNLLSNAYKFTDAGGHISLSLRFIQVTENRMHFVIIVADTGKGMSPEFLKDIFNPFAQEDRSISRRFGGTGLGMAISDQFTRLMGGHVTVESELGVGSTFEVHLGLPMANQSQIKEYLESGGSAIVTSEDLEASERFKLKGAKILFAEDNMLNASLAMEMFEELGASVDHAKDGVEVCEMFSKSEPNYYDIIFMDIQMPNMNGWDAAAQIRKMDRVDARDMIVIALSADAYVEDKRHSRAVGMNGHLSKPIDFEQLENLVNAELALDVERAG